MIKFLTINVEDKYRINKRLIHKIISKLKDELKFSIDSLTINFISAETILTINKHYLNHHHTTDIITFNYSGDLLHLDGELFISIEDSRNNSHIYRCTHDSELFRLITHGILHLMGYDDRTMIQKRKMKKIENLLVSKHEAILNNDILIYDSKIN